MSQRHDEQPFEAIPLPAFTREGAFVQLPSDQLPCLDRQLGYFGDARYVSFRYELRGEEVIWDDGHCYGFGAGAWQVFLTDVAPLAQKCGVGVGVDDPQATHALLIDRQARR